MSFNITFISQEDNFKGAQWFAEICVLCKKEPNGDVKGPIMNGNWTVINAEFWLNEAKKMEAYHGFIFLQISLLKTLLKTISYLVEKGFLRKPNSQKPT